MNGGRRGREGVAPDIALLTGEGDRVARQSVGVVPGTARRGVWAAVQAPAVSPATPWQRPVPPPPTLTPASGRAVAGRLRQGPGGRGLCLDRGSPHLRKALGHRQAVVIVARRDAGPLLPGGRPRGPCGPGGPGQGGGEGGGGGAPGAHSGQR